VVAGIDNKVAVVDTGIKIIINETINLDVISESVLIEIAMTMNSSHKAIHNIHKIRNLKLIWQKLI